MKKKGSTWKSECLIPPEEVNGRETFGFEDFWPQQSEFENVSVEVL